MYTFGSLATAHMHASAPLRLPGLTYHPLLPLLLLPLLQIDWKPYYDNGNGYKDREAYVRRRAAHSALGRTARPCVRGARCRCRSVLRALPRHSWKQALLLSPAGGRLG